MAFKEYGNYDAVGLAEAGSEQDVTARELLDEAIARTAKVDPQINAVVVKHYDYAERQIERGLPDGLHRRAVPAEGPRPPGGNAHDLGATVLKDFVADHSGTLVQRFLDTGVSIFGKSSSPRIRPDADHGVPPARADPQSLESRTHSSGGSSGGAAAAVAARILPVAHASDGGGSIRIPASASGVFGLKPTRARNPLGPDRGEGWGGSPAAMWSASACATARRMMDAIHGPEPSSPYRGAAARGPRRRKSAAIPAGSASPSPTNRPDGEAIDPEVAAAVREIAGLLAGLGHHVEERAPVLAADPAAVCDHRRRQHRANGGLIEQALGRAADDRRFRDTDAGERTERAKDRASTDYVAAQLAAFQVRATLATFFESCDVFLCPTLCTPPLRIGELNAVEGSVAYCPDPAPLYARRPRCSTCPASPRCRCRWRGIRPDAARHDVLGQIRR